MSARPDRRRSTVDVPFSHGTLAASSTRPGVFARADREIMQDMAGVLSEGFHRMEDLQRLAQRNQALEHEIEEHRRTDQRDR